MIICVPILFVLIQELFSVDTVILSDFSIVVGIWYTFFKCLATILAVPAYRKAFLRPFTLGFWKRRRRNGQEVDTIEKSTSQNNASNLRSMSVY